MKKLIAMVLCAVMLATLLLSTACAAEYTFDASHPYDGVMSGLFTDVAITTETAAGIAAIYLPEGLQPWTPAVIVLTPDNTTAAEFAESEIGLAWRKTADDNLIGLAFLEPADGKNWNLTLSADGRDDAAVLNQLYMTMRSKSVKNVAPFSMDKSHTTVVGYGEGGAAALLFGAANATDFSGLAAVDATEVPAASLEAVSTQLVLPFPADSTVGVEEMHVEAKDVAMPVWFINSADNNAAAVEYFTAADESNDNAEVKVTAEAETPADIYSKFLSKTKRFMAMQKGGRLAAAEDFTREGFTVHEEEINGETRRWITYVPASYDPDTAAPLVVVMHGYTASMYAIAEESRWYDVADENGFIVIFMQALVREIPLMGNIPAATWVAGAFSAYVDLGDKPASVDVDFIREVISRTEADYSIDASRVYATGHSNGSMMTATLATEMTDVFAAVAPIGYMTTATAFSSDTQMPTWFLCGEYDSAVTSALVEGNATVAGLQSFNALNGTNEAAVTTTEEYDGQWKTLHFANADGVDLVRYTVVGGTPHVYMPEESVTVWNDFFSKYSRGENGECLYEGQPVTASEYVADAGWYEAAPAETTAQ